MDTDELTKAMDKASRNLRFSTNVLVVVVIIYVIVIVILPRIS